MYQTKDNDLQMKIHLEDIPLQLVMSCHSRYRVNTRTSGKATPEEVFYRIALLLEQSGTAAHINDNVKIGDEFVIFDADTGFTYAMSLCASEIVVTTFFAPSSSCDMKKVGANEFCMFIKQAEVLCADIFKNVRSSISTLAQTETTRLYA